MDASMWKSLPPDLAEATLKSFEESYSKANFYWEGSEKELTYAEEAYQKALAKHELNTLERDNYKALVASLTDYLDSIGDLRYEPSASKDEPTPVVDGQQKRITYPISPKVILANIISASVSYATDMGLKQLVEYTLNIPYVPLKTIQNKLIELDNEGVIKRVKVKGLGFISGRPEWFDENNEPIPVYFDTKQQQ